MSHARRPLLLGALCALIATGVLAGLTIAGPGATMPERPLAPPDVAWPCNPSVERTIEPLVISDLSETTVKVRFNFACPTGKRKVNLAIVENGQTATIPGEPQLTANLSVALQAFVNAIDPATGSRGGHIIFDTAAHGRLGLSAFSTWPPDWADVWVSGRMPTAGMLPALRDAAAMLPADAAAQGAENIVILILAGTDPIGTPEDMEASCRALAGAGARLAAVALPAPGNNGTLHTFPCISWYLRSTESDGSDLASVFQELGTKILEQPQVDAVEVYDSLTDAFGFVRRSGVPRDPDSIFTNQLTWTFPMPTAGEQVLQYRVKAMPGWMDTHAQISTEARFTMFYSDGTEYRRSLQNPSLCIYNRHNPEYCETPPPTLPAYLPISWGRAP